MIGSQNFIGILLEEVFCWKLGFRYNNKIELSVVMNERVENVLGYYEEKGDCCFLVILNCLICVEVIYMIENIYDVVVFFLLF